MIPMMIDQGYRAVVVLFDLWGITHMVHGALEKGRAFAQQSTAKQTDGVNGSS